MKDFISTQDAATALGVSARRIRAMIKAGQFPNVQTIGEGRRAVHLIAVADMEAVRVRRPGRPRKPAPAKPAKAKAAHRRKKGSPK